MWRSVKRVEPRSGETYRSQYEYVKEFVDVAFREGTLDGLEASGGSRIDGVD